MSHPSLRLEPPTFVDALGCHLLVGGVSDARTIDQSWTNGASLRRSAPFIEKGHRSWAFRVAGIEPDHPESGIFYESTDWAI